MELLYHLPPVLMGLVVGVILFNAYRRRGKGMKSAKNADAALMLAAAYWRGWFEGKNDKDLLLEDRETMVATLAKRNMEKWRSAAAQAMGVDWMTRDEMCQAIPPAYTLFIGVQLLHYLQGDKVL